MGEQIPAGFTPETWEKLTPEQKQIYLNAQTGNTQTANQQDGMMKNIQKMTMISMIVSTLTSFLPGIFRRFFRE
jgi:hypothetical protein